MLTQPRTALRAALTCLAGLVITGVLAELVPAARVRDSASLSGFASLQDTSLSTLLNRIAHIADSGPYALLSAALVVAALARGRRRLAATVAVVLVAAPATSEVLKHVVATPRSTAAVQSYISAASWPSGHATAAMTLALCGVLVAPPALRPMAAALGGLFTIAVSYAVLVFVWHFPSDVIGGLFVAAMYALLAIAFLRRWPDPHHRGEPAAPRVQPATLWPAIAVCCVAAGAGLALAIQRPPALVEHVSGRPSFVFAALAIAGLAVGLAALLVHSARSSN